MTGVNIHVRNETAASNLHIAIFQKPPELPPEPVRVTAWKVLALGPGQMADPVRYEFAYQVYVRETVTVGSTRHRTTLHAAELGEAWEFVQTEGSFTALKRASQTVPQSQIAIINKVGERVDCGLAVCDSPIVRNVGLYPNGIAAFSPFLALGFASVSDIEDGDVLPDAVLNKPGAVHDLIGLPRATRLEVRVSDAPDAEGGLAWAVEPRLD